MRLKTKRQDQERSVKQREMQLEDTVGVYTRINMIKGSLNYKGKPRHRYEKSRKAIAFSKLSLVHTCDKQKHKATHAKRCKVDADNLSRTGRDSNTVVYEIW